MWEGKAKWQRRKTGEVRNTDAAKEKKGMEPWQKLGKPQGFSSEKDKVEPER